MLVHTAQVRGRKIAWDKREVVQHGLNADRIKFDLDAEFRGCDSYQVVLCGPSLESPKRYIPDKDMTVAVPPSLMESTGPVSTCLLGYVGGEVRVVTAQERYPLVVVESGFTGPLDPGEEQPDLWAQIMSAEAARIEAELARESAEKARADAEAKRIAAEKARETASAEAVKAANEAAAKAEQAARQAENRVTAALAEVAKAEQARTEAEKARAAAESSRAEAEAARIAAESKRESAEAKRKADSAKAVADASAATSAANAAAGKADAAAQTATDGEASRVAAETARAEAEQARATAETGRVEAEATRAANESERTETFNTNLVSWNSKVDAACKKATDTASKAAQDAKTATDAAIAKTEEATNAAVAKAQTATDNATTAANKAETVVAQLPIPSGNVLKGEAEATLAHVDDAYPAPLVTTKVLGQSNQQQEPAPSPENPQEITNLNKAELVITGKNLINADGAKKSGWNVLLPNTKLMNGATYVFTAPKCKQTCSIYATASDTRLVGFIGSGKTERFTVPSNADFSKGCFIAGSSADSLEDMNTVINTVMVEVGTVASGYSAPKKYALTTIDLKGNELCSLPNGVKDEVVIDAEGNVSLIKRTKQYDWNCAQIIKGTGRNYAVDKVLDIGANYTGLVAEKAINDINNTIGICYVNQKMIYVTVPESVTTKEQANQLYGGMKVIYQLAEPQTIPLGKVELPALPESTSNVWNDGNIPANVYINYLKDVNIAFADLESKLTQAVVAAAANL